MAGAAAMATATAGPAAALLAKAAALWATWCSTHDTCVAALAAAANVAERLGPLEDGDAPRRFEAIEAAAPGARRATLDKQLAALDRALAVVRSNHETLRGVVRDLERLHVEATRALAASGPAGLAAAAAAAPGPQLGAVECAECLHDLWVMCRDEMLLKTAALGLVTLDAAPSDLAALLRAYADQPNVDARRVELALAQLRETSAAGAAGLR